MIYYIMNVECMVVTVILTGITRKRGRMKKEWREPQLPYKG